VNALKLYAAIGAASIAWNMMEYRSPRVSRTAIFGCGIPILGMSLIRISRVESGLRIDIMSYNLTDPTLLSSKAMGRREYASLLHLASDLLIAGGADGSIRSWSLTSMDLEPRELSAADGTRISALSVEGSLIVSGSNTGVLRVINRYYGTTVTSWTLEGERIAVFQVGLTARHSPVAAYRKDESILVTIL
jgi:WD40 repeat protein